MIFTETKLQGAFVLELEKLEDQRGFFAHSWSPKELTGRGLEAPLADSAISFNETKGTLRGMHYQAAPHGQAKIVRCTMGSIYDVIIDLRTGSPTLMQWMGLELSSSNRLMLYVPKGFAHGFQALEDKTEVFYNLSDIYAPQSARGMRWDDPALGINWPLPVTVISEKDKRFEFLPENQPKPGIV